MNIDCAWGLLVKRGGGRRAEGRREAEFGDKITGGSPSKYRGGFYKRFPFHQLLTITQQQQRHSHNTTIEARKLSRCVPNMSPNPLIILNHLTKVISHSPLQQLFIKPDIISFQAVRCSTQKQNQTGEKKSERERKREKEKESGSKPIMKKKNIERTHPSTR